MCGIAGEVRFDGRDADVGAVARITEAMHRRGPDGSGVHAMGRGRVRAPPPEDPRPVRVRRPADGRQRARPDRRLQRPDLQLPRAPRAELEGHGYRFFSTTDTEVLLKAFHRWGAGVRRALPRHVRLRRRRPRHRRADAGPRPAGHQAAVPTRRRASRLRFASALPALLEGGEVDTVDRPGRAAPLHELPLGRPGAAHDPERRAQAAAGDRAHRRSRTARSPTTSTGGPSTCAAPSSPGCRRPTGATPCWRRCGWPCNAAWSPTCPVGVLLSGGLDSSLVVGLLAQEGQVGAQDVQRRVPRHRRRVRRRVRVLRPGRRASSAPTTSRSSSTRHRLLPAVDEAITAMAEPMVSHDCVAFYLLSRGGLEVGHGRPVRAGRGRGVRRLQLVPAAGRGAAGAGRRRSTPRSSPTARTPSSRTSSSPTGCSTTTRRRAFIREHFAMPGAETTLDAALRMDSTIMLVDDPVKRVDNMTMAWGLEARVPFLDHELVELAAACPPELKLAHGGKGVLKEAARGNVPDGVIDRPKGYFPGTGHPPPRGSVPRPRARRRHRPRRKGARAGPQRLARGDAGGPEHRTDQPRLERAVAGGAAGDVAAGEGDLIGRTPRGACSADERRGDRGRLRPAPDGPAVGRARSGAVRDGLLLLRSPPPTAACWPGSPTATAARAPGWPRCPRTAPRSPSRPGRCADATARPDAVSRGTCRRSPGRPTAYWIACQLAPVGGERTRVRLVTPDGTQVHDLAPSAPAVTLGSWSPERAPARRSRSSAPGTGDGWPAWSTCATARRRCSPPAPRRWSARSAATACAPWSARPPRRPPAGAGRPAQRAAHRAAARRRGERRRRPFRDHRRAAVRALRRRRASGPRCWPSGCNGDAEPSLPYLIAEPRRRRSGPRRAGPERARAPRWCGTSTAAARSSCWTCAPGIAEPLPGPPGDVVTGAAFTRDGRALLVGNEGPTVPPTITRIAARSALDGTDAGRVVADRPTPLLPAAPRDAGHLVEPDAAPLPRRGRAPPVGLAVPARGRASAPYPTLHLAARRPGGPGTADLPAAVPGAARRGRRGVRAERPRLRRLRPHVLPGRRPGPAVRRDHRRARRGRRRWSSTGWPTRPGSACPAGRTAAT